MYDGLLEESEVVSSSPLVRKPQHALGWVGKPRKEEERLVEKQVRAKDVGVIRSALFTGCCFLLAPSE